MSDYLNIDAFTEGSNYGWDMAKLRLEVAAMLKQLEALKKEEKMSGYPNIDAVVQGRVSGESFNWPQLRLEVMGVMEQLKTLRKEFKELANLVLADLFFTHKDVLLDKKDKQLEALKDEVDQLQVTKREISDRASRNYEAWEKNRDEVERLKEQLSGLCQPIAITDEMVAQANEKIKVLKQFLNNQASTIAKLRQDARVENDATKEMLNDIKELKNSLHASISALAQWRQIARRSQELCTNKDVALRQLSAELVETQKDASFLRVKELREEIKQLRETVADWEELLNE